MNTADRFVVSALAEGCLCQPSPTRLEVICVRASDEKYLSMRPPERVTFGLSIQGLSPPMWCVEAIAATAVASERDPYVLHSTYISFM